MPIVFGVVSVFFCAIVLINMASILGATVSFAMFIVSRMFLAFWLEVYSGSFAENNNQCEKRIY